MLAGIVVGIACGLLVLLMGVVLGLLFIYCKEGGRWRCSASPSTPLSFGAAVFTLDEVKGFTHGFSNANLLGEGGFGRVYRGIRLSGEEVAVKRLKVGGGQGEREFLTEVEVISRVHHKRLVSLVGYCTTGSERILVYDLVPNNTLEFHLHGGGRLTLDWPTRIKIASGSAEGLAYLHEECDPMIIHRDIKATNILLDNNFEAKIADFGLAKRKDESTSHVSTNVKGTFGYLAPEYASSGNLTEKSDTFSFGVVLLELITGRRPRDGLVYWARPLLTRAMEDGKFDSLVDPKLKNKYVKEEMTRMVACAAACVRDSAVLRPRMKDIVLALQGNLDLSALDGGMTPGLSLRRFFPGNWACRSSHDLEQSKKIPLASQDSCIGPCIGPTSEYDRDPSGSGSEGPSRQTTQDLEMERMETDGQGFSGGCVEITSSTSLCGNHLQLVTGTKKEEIMIEDKGFESQAVAKTLTERKGLHKERAAQSIRRKGKEVLKENDVVSSSTQIYSHEASSSTCQHQNN